jgi:hypothetical protein
MDGGQVDVMLQYGILAREQWGWKMESPILLSSSLDGMTV